MYRPKSYNPRDFALDCLIILVVWLVVVVIYATTGRGFGADVPPLRGPLGIPPSAAEIELGRKLFFDARLSQNGTISCSSCHNPAFGWSDGQAKAVGILGQVGTRNSPTIINASYSPLQFWDGRVVETVSQALLPMSNPIEMGQQSEADVIARLRLNSGYVSLFAQVYGVDPVTASPITGVNLARAIAAFETSVLSFDAPVDRYLAGDLNALTPDARVGFKLFKDANCIACHTPPLFSDNGFHNQGAEFATTFRVTDPGRAAVIPQAFRTRDTVRAFKTPTLREIARTAPYMHNGQMADLERVVLHYSTGAANYQGRVDPNLDRARIRRQDWTPTQRAYVVKFLREGFASPNYPNIEAPELPQ